MRNRIDHWCTVEPGNPNPPVHRSSGKLGEALFPTGTVDPRVGISLSPLNTNDGFSLSLDTESIISGVVGGNSLLSVAQKSIYPLQCFTNYAVDKEFALKNFMWVCIESFFEIQYERDNKK